MKNLWTAVGIAAGTFCLLGILLFGLAYNARNKIGQDARAYVKQSAPIFLASDNGAEFLKVAAPQLKANTPQADADKMFALIHKKLGKFQGLQKVILGESTISKSPAGAEQFIVQFHLQADYDQGPAEFDVAVVREGDAWHYAKLNLTTDLRD